MSWVKVCTRAQLASHKTNKLLQFQINTFHWHVVDSQSFPLEVPAFPELSQKGSYSSSMVYSSNDIKDIVAYAGEVCCPPLIPKYTWAEMLII